MTLAAGTRLGPYEVLEPIGKGGMGEVFRARDTKLERDVAIKVLPDELASDQERVARFEREAKLLASLNHPNIASIYGFEEADGVKALALELVEGPTLGERIQQGPIPVEEAIAIAKQIAEALEAGHEAGVIHRDLKPANIKVREDGTVKVLDYGLAKAFKGEPPSGTESELSQSPTLTRQGTQMGVILGTAAYMSPEQAKGRRVDKRTDIWAFGAVVYEMLTGKRLFSGKTSSEILASVIKDEPSLDQLPAATPKYLRHLLNRCLTKDPPDRLQAIGEARIAIARPAMVFETNVASAHWKRAAVRFVVVGVLTGALITWLVFSRTMAAPPELPKLRYVMETGDMRSSRPEISPDGTRVAYSRMGSIWVRELSELSSISVQGTQGGSAPIWSPDGDWLAFVVDGQFWKIRADGSGRTKIGAQGVRPSGGAVWLHDGRIVFSTGLSGLLEVSERGGETHPLLEPGEGDADFHFGSALPGGRGFLFAVHEKDGSTIDNVTLWDGVEKRTLLRVTGQFLSSPVYSATGHILFARRPSRNGIWAAPFSLDSLEVTGDPFPVEPSGAWFSLASNGTLVYETLLPAVRSEIVVVDNQGRVVRTVEADRRGIYPGPALSPDGRRLCVPIAESGGFDLWVYDLSGGAPKRITFDEASSMSSPTWTPDGRELIVAAGLGGSAQHRRVAVEEGATGSELGPGNGPVAFGPDGSMLFVRADQAGLRELWRKNVAGDGTEQLLIGADAGSWT